MPTEIIELPTGAVNAPVRRINPLTLQREAAEATAAAPKETWTPAPSIKPENARVSQLKSEAEAVRAAAAAESARADFLTTAAKIVGQKIASLERERTQVAQRLAVVEAIDMKSRRETARENIHNLYGKDDHLSPAERVTLNDAIMFLAWSPALDKELPIIVRNLKARLAEIEKHLVELTGTGTGN